MNNILDMLMVLMILTGFVLLGSSRLAIYIRMVALHGYLLGFIPILVAGGSWHLDSWLLGIGIIALKGLIFPYFLQRVIRDSQIRREIEPFIGYPLSILLGVGVLALSLPLANLLPLPLSDLPRLLLPTAFFTMGVGFILIVSRRTALSQVLGYLVLENGIFIFGTSISPSIPLVVELGILLDVFVAVFIMGIMIFRIYREFDHIDTDQMAILKE